MGVGGGARARALRPPRGCVPVQPRVRTFRLVRDSAMSTKSFALGTGTMDFHEYTGILHRGWWWWVALGRVNHLEGRMGERPQSEEGGRNRAGGNPGRTLVKCGYNGSVRVCAPNAKQKKHTCQECTVYTFVQKGKREATID